jgi:glutamate--cysteine ligase
VGFGMDPVRSRDRIVHCPRYDAMEAYFDRVGTAGRTMMRDTAGLQVNLDVGTGAERDRRWRLLHVLGPTLAATFSNSPLVNGMPSGWRSTRLATWSSVDPSRTGSVAGPDPARAWADYILEADVMLVRAGSGSFVPQHPGFTFGRWVAAGHQLGYPTEDDLAYHVSTLFPMVRPRGWLELRMIDALPEPWWRVAVAVTAALVYDQEAGERALAAATPTAGLWRDAARSGLGHPALERSAQHCFAAALEALSGVGTDPTTVAAALQFYERYVTRGRCPADDPLDAWARDPNLALSQPVMDAWT